MAVISLRLTAERSIACPVMPHQSRRLSGWVVLLALAGVGLGTAVALSRRSSKRTSVVLPTPRAPLPPAAVASAPASTRSLLRLAVGGAIVVVLAIAAAVLTQPSSGGRIVTPHLVLTQSGDPDGMHVQVLAPGPVGRDDRVALVGDAGARVEVGEKQYLEQQDPENANGRLVYFKVHLHNTGSIPVGARLAPDTWVLDEDGKNYRAQPLRSDLVDQTDRSGELLNPNWEDDAEVGFEVPQDARLTRLHIALPLGSVTPTAEWNLA